ncbi:MAG: hypothetical protein K0Q50_227 [Vampirovibrio sp.]|jgi:hypothetical protein|nr:hypothetical protein [Vampirovibrio sp.]
MKIKGKLTAKQVAWVISEYEMGGGDDQDDAAGFFEYLLKERRRSYNYVSKRSLDLVKALLKQEGG